MSINGVQTYIGLFVHEDDAALAVNQKCIELGLEIKNPMISINPDAQIPENTFDSSKKKVAPPIKKKTVSSTAIQKKSCQFHQVYE
jgi:hypothetical protein